MPTPAVPSSVGFDAIETLASLGKLTAPEVAEARDRADRGEALLHEAVEIIEGDARDWVAVREAVADADAVVHAVGIIRETEGRSFADTNIGTTQTLIDVMKDVGVNRLVYMGILGASDDPSMPYGRSRFQSEDAVMNSGLEWTIVKPSLVLGVSDAVSRRMVRTLRTGPAAVLPLPDGGRTLMQPMYVSDLAAVLTLCLMEQERAGNVYEIGGPEHIALRDIAKAFADGTQHPTRLQRPDAPIPAEHRRDGHVPRPQEPAHNTGGTEPAKGGQHHDARFRGERLRLPTAPFRRLRALTSGTWRRSYSAAAPLGAPEGAAFDAIVGDGSLLTYRRFRHLPAA